MNPILNLGVQLIILLLFWKASCSSDFYVSGNYSALKSDSEDLVKRTELMNELISLKDPIKQSADSGDQQKTQTLLKQLQDIWLKIDKISATLIDPNPEELRLQELRNLTAHLLFITRARHCESPDETFYKPMNKCLPVGSSEACPPSMSLNDGPDNESFCDCLQSPEFLFSAKTGQCHKQNSQGPCQHGEWFILDESTPKCELHPGDCPADGRHVYWSPNGEVAKHCWEMGTQGPCPFNEILIGTGGLDVICGPDFSVIFPHLESELNVVPVRRKPCEVGSYRDQFLQCRPSFFNRK